MYIARLLLLDFRSCAYVTLEPDVGINVFAGGNGQGKSTLLEAVYLLATTRSLRARNDSEMIRWNKEHADISARVIREDRGEVDLEASLSRTERRVVRVNHVRRNRISDMVGHLNAVLFTPSDLDIVRGEPMLRRRFLNLEIAQVAPHYCLHLVQYRRILEQRNRLLRTFGEPGSAAGSLEAWDEQLVTVGARIVERRLAFVADLRDRARRVYDEIAGTSGALDIHYLSSFPIECSRPVASLFREHLAERRAEETRRGMTVVGPHRDDLLFLVGGMDARAYGSQGEQRTVALAIKLAEVELIREQVGEPPVLLLDDAGTELDGKRRERLFATMHGECQTFVTCTDERVLPSTVLAHCRRFVVEAGTVRSA